MCHVCVDRLPSLQTHDRSSHTLRIFLDSAYEQKTTILWKCLYLLTSLKDSSGLSGTYETKRSSEEENPVHR